MFISVCVFVCLRERETGISRRIVVSPPSRYGDVCRYQFIILKWRGRKRREWGGRSKREVKRGPWKQRNSYHVHRAHTNHFLKMQRERIQYLHNNRSSTKISHSFGQPVSQPAQAWSRTSFLLKVMFKFINTTNTYYGVNIDILMCQLLKTNSSVSVFMQRGLFSLD